jgi:hypothetical protein
MSSLDQQTGYEIKIVGRVDESLVEWFGPVKIVSACVGEDGVITTLSAIDIDQAGVVGLIRHLHGLGIVLLSIERIALGA